MKAGITNSDRARSYLAVVLVALLAIPAELAAQNGTPAAQAPAAPKPIAALPTMRGLKVVPLAGNGEMNDLERRIMAPLVVQIRDQNDRPVEGADVIFRFPPNGPGAVFAGQQYAQKVRSNNQGQAAAVGWAANNQVGSFEVHVTATYGEQIGESTISMTNVTRITEQISARARKEKTFWSSRWFKLCVIAGGAGLAAGIVLATRSSGSSSPTITISTGSPTIGGPH
jgi:hypothetical protein